MLLLVNDSESVDGFVSVCKGKVSYIWISQGAKAEPTLGGCDVVDGSTCLL